jgi:signal transduction histidine kinase
MGSSRMFRAWMGRHLAAASFGLALAGLALCGLIVAVLAVEPVIAVVGLVLSLFDKFSKGWHDGVAIGISLVGTMLAPPWLLAVVSLNRKLANQVRVLSARWCGVPIASPYRVRPAGQGRLRWKLGDWATWRDLLWLPVNGVAGFVVAAAPMALLVFGVSGLLSGRRNINGPFTNGQQFALSIVAVTIGVWAAPQLNRAYAQLARSLLAPPASAELQQQVRHLTATRTETLDSGAAEIRRIERDLHDGAQARLVAMGMTLDAAGQLIDDDPKAARALLVEARDNSAKALRELRDLVRGIHPPVLADRGLAEAIRALALDTPLRIHLTSDLGQPARPSPPIESAAYFAVNELVANVSKHAHASQAWIDIGYDRNMLRITVTDDGAGGASPDHGSGLKGIERRLAAFDGVLAISSPLGGPTAVTMEIPCALS